MPQDACHAKYSTKLLQLNNSIVLAHIADSKRHDTDDSDIVESISLDRFAVSPYHIGYLLPGIHSRAMWLLLQLRER